MAIQVALHHVTRYEYDRPVMMSPHIVRLRPAPHARTPIHGYSMRILPEKHFMNWQQDPYSNYLARLVFPEKATELKVEVDLIAEMTVINPFDFFVAAEAAKYPFSYEPGLRKELQPYLEAAPPGSLVAKMVEAVRRKDVVTIDYLVELNWKVHQAVKYLIRLEPGVQTPEETLTKACGSCRDSAWLLVQLLRQLGLAARFVSGYLIQLAADVKSLDGPSGPEADFTDLHAWAEVYLPGAGWIGLDATSGLLTGEGHIPLACTADPQSAAPIQGGTDECKAQFSVEMTVRRIREDPRVTKPYTPDQWRQIEALGHLVDDQLKRGDVRLTMGGEPTFVSIDDRDGDEWNTTAVGKNKRRLSGELLRRLGKRFAPGGLMHYGQGKWYPGESLPRWSLACYWRKDGVPIWNDPALIIADDAILDHTDDTARRFITELASRLGGDVHPEHVIAGHEDVFYYLWKERRLPVNVDPFKSNLRWEEDRVRLAKVFEQGLEKTVGYALPLRCVGEPGVGEWQSSAWVFRGDRMYLSPGDSPMGLRLPLDCLPVLAEEDYPQIIPRDPMELLEPLAVPARQPHHSMRSAGTGLAGRRPQDLGRTVRERESRGNPHVRTAICAEARDGKLHLFMQPVQHVEEYLDLIARIEETAAHLKTPVIIEGYTPPQDPRVDHIKVTPDPGVIEVNIQPVHSWDEAVRVTQGLYEDAHHARLGTEKFMLDGKHSGTGGGNHIVVGGSIPSDSPFLRRPDLLKSLLGYWHNHPSLSYLFSGTFIGPTSQAPRADEGRDDNLYELEIALRQVPDPAAARSGTVAPWMVDRIFRHLLTDLTGNTHRAEFCIDKLYSPDSSSGRLGLVEFRGFEMPPHPQMSLTQQLLIRAQVAYFWHQPYTAPLVHWRTELHDRFMLPHFVAEDFADVLRDMLGAGFPLQHEWFAPHFEFRFPILGTIDVPNAGGIHLEVRQAIEPWNVLGEEPAGGGTARYVDSSLERIQLVARGLVNMRYRVAVNGNEVPLHSTGRNGEYIAGVRYRAWQPPSCLHPTIGVHVPLVMDIVDAWNKKAVGGCTYHVAHPGGRAHEKRPINAFEAEGRRIARFFQFGHTPGPLEVRQPPRSLEFPLTLDLRRA